MTSHVAPNSEVTKFDGRLRELEDIKKRAVQNEDFLTAKSVKGQIEALKSQSEKISELEQRKKKAIEEEDYELAGQYKFELARIFRDSQAASLAPAVHHGRASPVVLSPLHPSGAPPHIEDHAAVSKSQPDPYWSPSLADLPGRPPQSLPGLPTHTNLDDRFLPLPGAQPLPTGGGEAGGLPFEVKLWRLIESEWAESENAMDSGSGSPGPAGGLVPRDRTDIHTSDPMTFVPSERAPMVRKFKDIFGERSTCCLCAKRWQVRDAGLRALIKSLEEDLGENTGRVLQATCQILASTKGVGLYDASPQVGTTASKLVEAFLTATTAHGDTVVSSVDGKPRAHTLVKKVAMALVGRVDEGRSQRVREGAMEHLRQIAHGEGFGVGLLGNLLFVETEKAHRKGDQAWISKWLHCALITLGLLLSEFGLAPKAGVTCSAVMQNLIGPGLLHPNSEVRNPAVQACVSLGGMGIETLRLLYPHLEPLRPALRSHILDGIAKEQGEGYLEELQAKLVDEELAELGAELERLEELDRQRAASDEYCARMDALGEADLELDIDGLLDENHSDDDAYAGARGRGGGS